VSGYEIGSTVSVLYRNTDAAGALVNVGGTVSCQVTLPDGTTTSATITAGTTGLYTATLVATQAGRHRFRFTGTGANITGLPWTDVADVWPTDPRLVISLDDARAELNALPGERANDDELRMFIVAATAMLTDIGGMLGVPILPTALTEDHEPRGASLVLDRRPVQAVTSATEYSGTSAVVVSLAASPGIAGDTYTLDADSGVLVRRSGGTRTPWRGEVRVVYTWGSTVIPGNVITAGRALVAHLFQNGQRGRRPSFGGSGDDMIVTPAGYAVPTRVVQMLDPTGGRAVSGIA
jgi:hypothetical protein